MSYLSDQEEGEEQLSIHSSLKTGKDDDDDDEDDDDDSLTGSLVDDDKKSSMDESDSDNDVQERPSQLFQQYIEQRQSLIPLPQQQQQSFMLPQIQQLQQQQILLIPKDTSYNTPNAAINQYINSNSINNNTAALSDIHEIASLFGIPPALLKDSKLLEQDSKTEKGQVTVSVASLLQIMDVVSAVKTTPPPKPSSILSAVLKGESRDGTSVKFTCKFKVLTLAEGCTITRLLSKSVALESVKITRASLLSEELNAETIEIANKLNDTTSSNAIKGALANDKDLQSPEQQPTIILDSDFHSLMVFQSGQYTVEINALFPYSTERKTSVQINIPTAAQTDLEFSVFRDIILAQPEQIQIGVSPFLEATKSSQIISSPSSSPSNPATTGTVVATLKCQIPPSVAVNITWNPKSEEDIKAEEKKKEAPLPLHATVKQEHNLSVLDNLLSVYSEFNYTILNGSMSLFQICCDPDLKILNVDVASENSVAVKRWDTSIVNPEDSGYDELVSTVDNLGEKDKEPKMKGKGMPRQLIRIILEYAVEKDLCLSVSSEKELPSSSCQFICPSFRHVRSSVTRETGHIGVDSLATVEVDQLGTTSSVAVLDVSELPKSVVQKAVNPLVLAYKFLVPNYNITLDVKKHDDVSVLTACIDSAHFVLTVSEEGKLMYKLILVIRNTQKQYLRVLLPSDAEIWTTSVNKQSVKPAKDNVTGEVLIPLQKLGGPEDEPSKQNNHTTLGHAKCVVEFLYVRQPNGGNAPETSATIDNGLVNKLKPVIGKGDVSSQQQQQFQLGGSPSTGNNLNRFEAPLKQFTTEGAISVSFPALDIPINYLFVSCYLPQEYNYSEFEGDLREVKYFHRTPPTPTDDMGLEQNGLVEKARVFKKGGGLGLPEFRKLGGRNRKMQYSYNIRQEYEVMHKPSARGVVPVEVQMVTTGIQFRFERLMVVQQPLSVSVLYKKKIKTNTRQIDRHCIIS